MASKQRSKSRKSSFSSSKAVNSPSSSTTSSSKQFLENALDSQSSPATSSARSRLQYFYSGSEPLDNQRCKENVTVTVRFRPLSPREIRQGEEIAWFADGDTIVRNEHNQSIAYAYDQVFGPTTTTHHVYDVAAQHVVSGAMEGIDGTIFAYGVTSSGKTHTMQGHQRSPGIIPLALKDAFSIIQETPNQEFLLRISYLEIYNEVISDLLNPAGQNLRMREDAQGTFIEGLKEEVVLSPAHALSLIAAGEEHRHLGSTNLNSLSSRSHTIFTMTIESSPRGENNEGEGVTLSKLNFIDLAGSESAKVETSGIRRKEGTYINKSLLTLGTVISKLTEGKAMHIPYRDSKLTRLLQPSLSGRGCVSLICTITPASSNTEETHNTLKFANRAKHIEIRAARNKIADEKSLIKKYQNEIRCLKQELELLKNGVSTIPQLEDRGDSEMVILKQKLEDGQSMRQSRLEEEEEEKAILLARIQHLTKLILVSSKDSQSSNFSPHPGLRRRHSFGEEELAYLPHQRRDLVLDDETIDLDGSLGGNIETAADHTPKEERKSRKHGLLSWLKLKKRNSSLGASTRISERSSAIKSNSTPSTPLAEIKNTHTDSGISHSLHTEGFPSGDDLSDHRPNTDHQLEYLLGQEALLNGLKAVNQIELLREQKKILCSEVALHSSVLTRLSKEAARNQQEEHIQVEMRNLDDEIKIKNDKIASLEKQIIDSIIASQDEMDKTELSQSIAELVSQLNELTFDLEVKAADNRIIQEQLSQKIRECEGLQEMINSLKQQLSDALESKSVSPTVKYSEKFNEIKNSHDELCLDKENVSLKEANEKQVRTIEELRWKLVEVMESKRQLESQNQKLAEEGSYAKGLASAAGVELKALSEEVAKLMNQNDRLASELASLKSSPSQRGAGSAIRNGRREGPVKRFEKGESTADLKKELAFRRQRELSYGAALVERDQRESELQRMIEESKKREAYLENELADMWVLVAKLKKDCGTETERN